jgi:hypothetical protein
MNRSILRQENRNIIIIGRHMFRYYNKARTHGWFVLWSGEGAITMKRGQALPNPERIFVNQPA